MLPACLSFFHLSNTNVYFVQVSYIQAMRATKMTLPLKILQPRHGLSFLCSLVHLLSFPLHVLPANMWIHYAFYVLFL